MPRRKSRKLAEFTSLDHVFDESLVKECGGFAKCFDVERPVLLDVGCGKGEHTIALAKRRPDHNVVGIDLKAARLHAGATLAHEQGLSNVAFFQMEWRRIPRLISAAEVEEAHVLFPDPHPKQREAHRRLTTPENLIVFQRILRPGARIHLRSDSPSFLEYTAAMVAEVGGAVVEYQANLPADLADHDDRSIHTLYESRFREEGRDIGYLCFYLPELLSVPA
jgi:tRNA (guanine-N7-)-methyltransferase